LRIAHSRQQQDQHITEFFKVPIVFDGGWQKGFLGAGYGLLVVFRREAQPSESVSTASGGNRALGAAPLERHRTSEIRASRPVYRIPCGACALSL